MHTLFKQFLLLEDAAVLKASDDWKLIDSNDQAFAKKLVVAWEGDARDYEKNRLGDPLFTKMVQPDSVKKLSKLVLDDQLTSALKRLSALFYKAMPKHSVAAKSTDTWWHERHVREYLELREEVEKILTE